MRERLDRVEHPSLSEPAAAVEREFTELQNAMVTLASEDVEYAQLQAKELASYIYDVFTAAELLSVAQTETEAGDARMALLAAEFIEEQFGRTEARGITSGSRQPIEAFDAIVRYASVAPKQLEATSM